MPRRGRHRGRRGDGTIIERDGKYLARYSTTEGGKRKRPSKTFTLRNDAEWWLNQAKRHGSAPDDHTVATWMDQWLAGKRRIAQGTRVQYASHVALIKDGLGGHDLTELRRRHVEAFVTNLAKYRNPRTHKALSASTIGKVLQTLRTALEAAVPREIPDNPAAKVEAPTVARTPVAAMTPAYAAAMVGAVRGTWLEHIVRVLLGSGMRIGEAVALNQVDVQEGFVRLRESKTTIRAVRLSSDANDAIHEAIRQAPRVGPGEPVFFSPRSRRGGGGRDRMLRYSVTRSLPLVLREAGLEPITPHKIRHGTATLMVRSGVPMRRVAEQLGHANPSLTANTYAHVAPDDLTEAVRVLDVAIAER